MVIDLGIAIQVTRHGTLILINPNSAIWSVLSISALQFTICIDVLLTHYEPTIIPDVDVVARCIITIVKVTDVDVAIRVEFDASAFESVVQMFTEAGVVTITFKSNRLA